MHTRRLLSLFATAALLGSPACASTSPEPQAPGRPRAAFVEQQNLETRPTSGVAPIESIDYWARPTQTADECLAEARALGVDARRRVEVSTMPELLAALDSETVILLRPGRYVFEDCYTLGDEHEYGDIVFPDWPSLSPHYDGGVIHDIHDLALINLGPEPAVIIQPDNYAPALSFRNVKNLAIYNLVIGHRPQLGWCQGGVIRVIEGENVHIAGSTLFGSGTEGLSLVTVDGLSLRDSVITDCSEQFSTISNSRNVVYERVEIAGNRGRLLRGFAVYRSTVTLVDSILADNSPLTWEGNPHNSYDLLFAIDIDYDWGTLFVDNPRALEPDRRSNEVVLRRTVVDGLLIDRTL